MYIEVEDTWEALKACKAIAVYRIEKKCTCDPDCGYFCPRCKRLKDTMDDDGHPYTTFLDRYRNLIYKKRVKK